MTVHIYCINSNVIDPTHYLTTNINVEPVITNELTVLSKEQFTCNLGDNLEYLWNRMHIVYSSRPYKVYPYDIYLTYTEDVYEVFSNGTTVKVVDNNGSITTYRNKLHSAGDIVLDSDGKPIILHKAGDIILDDNNLPILDTLGGMYRYIDVFMLEYEYYVANSNAYVNYLKLSLDTIYNWITNPLAVLNKNVLENTIIQYKPNRVSKPVEIYINNVVYNTNYIIKPTVTLYTTKDTVTATELETYTDRVGRILHKHLDTVTINKTNIENDIIADLGTDIKGADISGLDSAVGNLKMFELADVSNRITLGKVLTYNKSKEYVVKYNITIRIQTI
jgi:hypothetical protein